MSVSMWIYLMGIVKPVSFTLGILGGLSLVTMFYSIGVFLDKDDNERVAKQAPIILLLIFLLTFSLAITIPSQSTMQKMFIAEKLHADKLIPMISDCVEKATRYVLDVIPCVKSMEVEQAK